MTSRLVFIFFILFGLPRYALANFFSLTDYHRYGPVPARSQNPLYLLFLSEAPETAATNLKKKSFQSDLSVGFSNLFEYNPQAPDVAVDIDMELVRTAVRFRYAVSHHSTAGIELPFLSTFGGFMDAFIQGYHDAFGFPNADRDRVSNGRFSYQVTRAGTTLYQPERTGFGLSDMVLFHKLHVFEETKKRPALAVKSSVKLPTGAPSKGTGSGHVDYSFGFLAEKHFKRLHSYSGLSLIKINGHPQLNPILKKGSLVFNQAFELNMTEHLSFIGQIHMQTPLFKDVTIHEIDEPIVDLVFGFTGEKSAGEKTWTYALGFSEDPTASGPSIDFTVFVNAGLKY